MKLSDFDLDNILRIGVDKIQLSGFAIRSIDFQTLLQNNKPVDINITTDPSRKCLRHLPGTNEGVRKITIKDNQIFQELIIGCTNDSNGLPIEYCYLKITVDNAKKCNLENMTYNEYTDYINSVLSYIEAEYGIILFTDYMKLDYMEINANILLEQEFTKYNRVFRLLMAQFDNHLGKLRTYSNLKEKDKKGLQEESYTRGNKSKEIVFYDKTQELNNTGTPIEDNISVLRIELRLKTKDKIKSVFGSNFWDDLDDNKIVRYFHQEIYSYLIRKFEEWKKTREKELKKLIVNCKEKSTKIWHHLLMQEIRNRSESMMIPYVLDIEQVGDAFKKIPTTNRNTSRALHSLLNIPVEDDVYKNNDISKVDELFTALENYAKMTL